MTLELHLVGMQVAPGHLEETMVLVPFQAIASAFEGTGPASGIFPIVREARLKVLAVLVRCLWLASIRVYCAILDGLREVIV